MKKDKTRIMKPVYFNLEDPRENEINEWLESKFSSFGGLVKDLLYTQMLQEKSKIKKVVFLDSEEMTEKIEKTDAYDHNSYCTSSEVDDMLC